ncbi:ADP-ribosyl-[dinitrogen reductase] hydrolase (plasmid) [Maritalea myrionectae]|uniref:ADP-ribosyl-[dinitrogen reductase] hydrolase n=1 Tax=Maritalea myrionectae TaxID=454601 RepID=A0A2R4MJL2_9HYPH|nr:GFA family protein [Maritalea myrionectae]AVX06154.1 ADP-ribosyl-[dinitrogen reductase] hydrolase [Maritalea myrionectae]
MSDILTGRCFCGAMRYEVENSFDKMFFCSCDQCRQITGSAFASNLFTDSAKFRWTQGEEHLGRYDLPGRKLARTFCKICGSGVPKISPNGKQVMVPAGGLEGDPNVSIRRRIFQSERPHWHQQYEFYEGFDQFPV